MPRKTKQNSETTNELPNTGRFAYQGLDRVMHEKARLGILASLAAHKNGVLFNDLKQLCSLTDGNLSRHLGVLTEAGFIEIWKGSSGTRPQTLYRLTVEGRSRFFKYISLLESIVSDAQSEIDSKQRVWRGTDLPAASFGHWRMKKILIRMY